MPKFCFILLSIVTVFGSYAQTTYTSSGSGNFRSISWSPSTPPDFDDIADDSFIIRDGDNVTLASDVSINDLEIGEGGAGATLTIGNDATGRALTVGGNLTVLSSSSFTVASNSATHTVTVSGDIVHVGSTFDLTAGTDVANITVTGSVTSVLSGNTMTFNNLTLSGGSAKIITAVLDIDGDFVVDGNGTDVSTSVNNLFGGGFALTSGATYTATNSTQFFDGSSSQSIDVSGGSASFDNITFDNSSKTFTGNLVSDGVFEISDDADWVNTSGSHQLAQLEVKNVTSPVQVTNGTITFTGGEIRFEDGTDDDGSFTLGTNTNIIIDGSCSIERDDQVTLDGDMLITSEGYFIINGVQQSPPAGESDAMLNVTGTRTLTIEEGGDLQMGGYDNFPTGFTTYTLDLNSMVRYNADFDQIFRGENSANVTITFGRLYLDQPEDSGQRTKQLATGDDDLVVNGQLDLNDGIRFYISHAANITLGEDIDTDVGDTAGDPVFEAASSILTFDSENTQRLIGALNGNLEVDQFIITNSATPTTTRYVYIDYNIAVNTSFTIQNPNGTEVNTIIVDIDDFQIFGGVGTNENFTLGANCVIYTSSNDADGFAEGFSDAGDVISIDPVSVVRFDRAGNQSIPDFNGGVFGTIQFDGSGNKYVNAINASLDIEGDVTRIGGSPVFRFGTPSTGVPTNASHTVAGDWNMGAAYTGDSESIPGFTTALITFDGADQVISESDFDNVTFSGTGTKTITGTMIIDGDLTINDGVAVAGGAEAIDIAGNWTENGTGTYTQTGSNTEFLGGTTQTVVQSTGSTFYEVNITNSSTVDINSDVQIGEDLNIESGSSIDIDGRTLRVSLDIDINNGASITYTDPATTTIIMDGTTEQDLRNLEASQNFPNIQFEGVGNKDCFDNTLNIEGNLIIASEATFNANSEVINFYGDTWTNNGNFQHNENVNFLNDGGTTTVSTSSFHDFQVGDGAITTTVELAGNITMNGELVIEDGGTLDVSSSDYSITVEEDWNNYGTFIAQNGTVTFTGGESDFRSADGSTDEAQSAKAFYNLTINLDANSRFDVEEEGVVLNSQIDITNDLNIISGRISLREDTGTPVTDPNLLNVGGDLLNTGTGFEFRHENSRIAMVGTSGTHSIDLGGDQVRDFEINAAGATYQLTGDFLMRDDTDNAFELVAGTLDLNGQSLTINRGGLLMTGGTMIVDEGASLILEEDAANPNFNKTGGDLQIIGVDGNPATLSSVDDEGFTFTQSGGDIQAQYYTIANVADDGLNITGGTISGFSDGTFTSGVGTAYMTLANLDIGTISATNVIFNEGPTFNVAVDGANLPNSGSIEFVIAGGTLAGEQFEDDSPDGGATDGFVRWSEDAGFTWQGGTSSTWNVASNWLDTSGDADGIPDADDIIYIQAGTLFDPVIADGESFSVARVTIRNSGSLTFEGTGSLSVDGNFTIFSGSTLDMTDDANSTLNIAGAWSNAGTFNEGSATVTFNGTSGTHSITTSGNGDPFNNLRINGDGATYTLGSVMRVSSQFRLSAGTFDASSGFDFYIDGDWLVDGGTFEPGQSRVRFSGSSGTQSISGGTMWDIQFEDAAIKSIDGNIEAADDILIAGSSGDVMGNDRTIYVAGDWDLDATDAFVPGTGTVIFNGTAGQNLEDDDSHALTFHNLIFQNAGTKDFEFTTTVNGDMSIVSDATTVDMETGSSLTIGGTLSQTGGELRIYDSNFPTASAYNLSGGEVEFRNDGAQTLPADITFNDIEIRDNDGGSTTATLTGDITLTDDLVLDDGAVTLDVAGFTINLFDAFSVESDETLTWNGGTLIHGGDDWYMDTEFNSTTRAFENLELRGTGLKRPQSDIAVNGNLTVGDGIELDQLTRLIINDGDGTFTMQSNSILDNRVVGNSLPSGFLNYSIDLTSRVDLDASGNQTLFTNGGTIVYGELRVYSNGTVTLDGDLTVEGNFDMNNDPTLSDAGLYDLTLNGSNVDIRDYTPSAGRTITFSGNQDQFIEDDDGSNQNLEFQNVVFAGTGTKTLDPNEGSEVTDIDGNVTINAGVTVTTDNSIVFSGTTFTNNGTFEVTSNTRPFVFDGGNTTMDPGVNDIAAMTVSNTSGTTATISTNGLNLGTGDLIIDADAEIDFSSLSHTLASEDVLIDASGSWILTGAILDFDQDGGQNIPVIDEGNANITGIPSIQFSTSGSKLLTGAIVVDDLTIGAATDFDVSNANSYQVTVNGNWNNDGGDFFEREGTVVFNSDDTNAKTIEPNGEDFATVTFQGTAIRTYSLQSDMQIEGDDTGAGLTLASATLDLNGNILTLGDNDGGDPDAEINIIGTGGTLEVDAGATLQFDVSDDGGDVADTEIGGNLDVQSGGILNIIGSTTEIANVTRSDGANRIDINIESGGEIGAQYYSIQYLTDEGLEVEDGATINATNNFSNGSFSNLDTDAGDGSGGDDNPATGNRYLNLESDVALTITNVTFNFNGSPTVGEHFNVTRSNDVSNSAIDFDNSSGPLGRTGATYEDDGDPTTPAESNGQLTWEVPDDTQWIGGTSIDWTDATNWDNGVPSIATNDREAVIALGQPFNPTIDGTAVNISGLVIEDGILKALNSTTLDVDGDVTLGDGSAGVFVTDNATSVSVEGSWTTSDNAILDNGDGTITFDAASGSSVSITPGEQNFYSLTFTNATTAGEFNIVATTLDLDGDLVIENSATLIPSSTGYEYYIAGDVTATGGTFDTDVDGEVILDGSSAQTITDISFDELTVTGSGTKTTSGTVVVNDNFEIESGSTLSGGGAITFNEDVTIHGTLNGVTSQTYTFTGEEWIADANSYTGDGTVVFNAAAGNQYIRQVTAGDFPVEFHNLTLSGSANIELGRLIGGNRSDGNVDLTGDLTVESSINVLEVFDYLIDNTSGTGTFTLQDDEIIDVDGADHFPANFAVYALDDNSTTRYWGTIDQSIRGVEYGNLDLLNSTTKTLGGDINVDGDLYFRNATLDASANNYSINLAGRWDTNNGNDDGSFIARSGTVTFDGDIDQTLDLGETGTQDFNDILVNKSGGNVEVSTSNMVILGDINVFNGTFDINGFQASIAGNMNASGTGVYSGSGLYLLNATAGSPTVGMNGSVIAGSMEVDAAGRTYELVSDMTLLGSFTLTAGTFDVNGQTMSVGDAEDVVEIFGTLNVSTTDKPGGTLALGSDLQLVVNPGGTFSLVGTASQLATLTSTGTTDYFVSITGDVGNEGNVAVNYYLIEYIGADGFYVNANTTIDATNNFSNGTFQNGISGGRYLRIENTQDLTSTNRIENVIFDDNPGGGASNIYKVTSATGDIEVFNYNGGFSGEDFDEDPNDLITWMDPPTVTWTGAVSTDWFTAGNWDVDAVPTSTQDVVIPQTLNEPTITDNATVAVAQNLTLELNARMIIDTDDAADVDLQITGDITFEASTTLISSGADDDIEIGGSWIRLTNALFTPGTSQVTFNSTEGAESIDNSDSYYDLVLNTASTISLLEDLVVENDLTISSGSLNMSSFDITVAGDFQNSGAIDAQSQTVYLIPGSTVTRTFDPGSSAFYNLVIGEVAGNSAEYDLSSDLVVNHDFNLITGTLDPNTNDLTFGDSDAIQDDINISGTIGLEANETIYFGNDAVVLVQSGGTLDLAGTNTSNVATLTRRTTGAYDLTVQSGGTFGAANFMMEYMANEGINLQSGSTLSGLSSGTFQNGSSATQYIRLSNSFASDITAAEITFNTGPVYNVRRNEAAGNNIIFEDASGALSGPDFELDDGVAGTGEVQWTYTDPLVLWTGATDNDWNTDSNWNPAVAPTVSNTVQIPDVSSGSNRYPEIGGTAESIASLTIFADAALTIDGTGSLTITEELSNSGTITMTGAGSISVGDSWTNNGIFSPGTSTVTFTSDEDVTVSGGISFYNLTIDAAGTGAGIVFSSSASLDVDNNFTITDGTFQVTDASHTVSIGSNLNVDATNGTFTDNFSTVTFDGANQNIGDGSGATITFNDLIISGSDTKTIGTNDILDINGDLTVNAGCTFSLANESVTFSGSGFDIDGTLTTTGGSEMTFDGSQIQVITGNSSSVTFDDVVINNTVLGDNDIQLNIDVTANVGIDFVEGTIQSSGSNPLTFADNAIVSYDGTPEVAPAGIANDNNSYVVGPVIKIGDDDFVFPVGEGSRMARIGISGATGTSATDQFSAEYFFTMSASADDPVNGSIVRVSDLEYWDISRLNGSAEPFVTLFWDATSEVTHLPTLTVAHYNGVSWDDEGNGSTSGDATSGSITSATAFTSFSPVTLATTNDATNPLPVELLSFKGEARDNKVYLSWSTASELNNDFFEVQKSRDGETFGTIGIIDGNGTSSEVNQYGLVDESPGAGTIYYRLKQVDFDGAEEYHEVIMVINDFYAHGIVASIYPNPTNPSNLNISITSGDDFTPITIKVIDLSGKVFHEEVIDASINIDRPVITNTALKTGIYFVLTEQGSNTSRSKLIIQE